LGSSNLFGILNRNRKREIEIVKLTARVLEKLDSGKKGNEEIAMSKRQGE
jgi:hypothetical protein